MSSRRVIQPGELQPITSRRLRGFRPIYQKELAYWFGTQRWLSQLIIWLSLTVVPLVGLTPPTSDRGISILTLFLWLGGTLMSIGTIVLAQGSIIEEKLTQTLLWICSKPLSSTALILAKFLAHAVFIGVIMLGGSAIFTYVAALIFGLPPQISLLNYLLGVWMIYLMLLFTLAFTLMLGTIFNRVGTVMAISLFVFFGGASLNANPQLRGIKPYTVWALQSDATAAVAGRFSSELWIAMSSTIAFTVLWLLIAIWQMKRYEL
ncbi:hypothetical protein H6F43_14410 [Leptolyngbya sp. FACHB-36]|uniref:ABC transporter permease n=1 Tax=Leptolyngbya sp. FACHB-36 TaxID=2692808 RepID=UPI00167FFB29|nr:hypothetical protein [Leptolyngbya sp. FACHB-36]MBD2021370.1 hypothetical protein [Leptolyngbya sp. FACHB-36]